MPYAPGITYRGDVYLNQGLRDAQAAIGGMLRGMMAEKQQREEMIGGLSAPPVNEMQPAQGFPGGSLEGPGEGTGEGGADEAMKKAAKATDAYRTLAATEYGLDPNYLKTLGTGELRGLVLRESMTRQRRKDALEELRINAEAARDAAMQRHYGTLDRQSQIALDQIEASKRFYKRVPELMQPRPLPPGYSGPPTPGLNREAAIWQGLSESGWAPAAADLDNLIIASQRSEQSGGGPVGSFTQAPGRKDYLVFWNSPKTTTLVPTKQGPMEPQEVLIGGQPSGWAQFPDGTYRRLPQTKDKIDAAAFDKDGDGILSQAEFNAALSGMAMGKQFGVYPGMKVGKGETAAPAPAAPPPPAPTAPPGTPQNPYRPVTRGDFDALPPGALFIDPASGQIRVKTMRAMQPMQPVPQLQSPILNLQPSNAPPAYGPAR